MYQISLFISGLLANLFAAPPAVREVEVIREVEVKDPHGIMPNDIAFIRKHTAPVSWKEGTTLEEVAYQQAQADLIRFIENKVVGRRVDRPL